MSFPNPNGSGHEPTNSPYNGPTTSAYDPIQHQHEQQRQQPSNNNVFAISNHQTFAQSALLSPQTMPSSTSTAGLPDYFASLPHSTQEILRKMQTPTYNLSSSAEWGDQWSAAREKIMKSMVSSDAAPQPLPIRGRGRGRPRSNPQGGGHMNSAQGPHQATATDSAASTPTAIRGRGGRPRGRGRGGRGGGGRGGKRKRDDDDDDDVSEISELTPSEDEADEEGSADSSSQSAFPTITKSGRSVLKPITFKPVIAEDSPSSGVKRKRTYNSRKIGTDQILCAKCLRGHSPPSNAIVLCDGCNSAYHQWCHDPVIEREVVDYVDKSWFCGKCTHKREVEAVPMHVRVSGVAMTSQQRSSYLLDLSRDTLLALLMHSTLLHPDLPIFPPSAGTVSNADQKSMRSKSTPLSTPPLSLPPKSSSANHTVSEISMRQSTSTTQHAHTSHAQAGTNDEEEREDPYPDHSNEWGDPPATYPKPGQGPHAIRPTLVADDLPWLLDENSEVFSHLVADENGMMVPLDRTLGGASQRQNGVS